MGSFVSETIVFLLYLRHLLSIWIPPRRYLCSQMACVDLVELINQLAHWTLLIYPWPNNLACVSQNDWTGCLKVTPDHSQGIVIESSETQKEPCPLPPGVVGTFCTRTGFTLLEGEAMRIFNDFRNFLWRAHSLQFWGSGGTGEVMNSGIQAGNTVVSWALWICSGSIFVSGYK